MATLRSGLRDHHQVILSESVVASRNPCFVAGIFSPGIQGKTGQFAWAYRSAAAGRVSDASSAGFTVVTSGGTRVRVTTSGDTLVVVPHASLGQLQHGATIFAVGHAGPDGTLSAQAVAAVSQLPPGVPAGVHPPAGAHLHISVHAHVGGHGPGCSPSAIAAALLPGG